MMLILYFLLPIVVLWTGYRIRPAMRASGLWIACAIAVVLGQVVLYLAFTSGIPLFTFGSQPPDSQTILHSTDLGWMLRYLSERFGWIVSIIWFWLSWLVFRLFRRKHGNLLLR